MVAPGCSLKRVAINSVANSLAETGDTFAADPDPELIRGAVPFSLKLVESLWVEVPNQRGLLLTACSGFAAEEKRDAVVLLLFGLRPAQIKLRVLDGYRDLKAVNKAA